MKSKSVHILFGYAILFGVFFGCGGSGDLERRLEVIETQTAASSVPVVISVVHGYGNSRITYKIGGLTDSLVRATSGVCVPQVVVGEPLPDSCW